MLLSYDRLLNTPVMSLQTGAELAHLKKILVDPRDLTIAAYELDGTMLDERPSFLRPIDVRELSNLGLIVDSSDEFVGLGDVIKIQQVYGYGFSLIGLDVLDERRKKLGKIHGYSVDSASFAVQQLNVKRPLIHSLGDTELLIHRTQIVEVQDTHVTVKTAVQKAEPIKDSIREYTNPFRAGNVQPEATNLESNWP